MRLRTKKNLEKRLEACAHLLETNPSERKGNWSVDKPLYLEIGCGKGAFILGMAKAHPEHSFVALEKERNVIVMAMEKIQREGLTNVRFLNGDARALPEYFTPGELAGIYLNFSDPWPKKGYRKNRLTHPNFLAIYKELLVPGGKIAQKTDNLGLFEFSLESYREMGCELTNLTYDLHNSGFEGNVITEYEQRFLSLGQPIYRVEASFPLTEEAPVSATESADSLPD